jgi:hypothetical protein
MSYRHTMEAVLESLHEIEDLVKGFPGNGNIPAVEMDLALQKIRNLYELMLMMKKPREEGAVAVTEKGAGAVAAAVTGEKEAAPAATLAPAATVAAVTSGAGAAGAGEVKTLSDQFKGRTTLHESLHQTVTKEGDMLAHTKPVTDLLTAIAINDRFTFIRELFNNDTAAFENNIKVLNDAASFNDAYNYMIQRFDWDMDSVAVQLLLDIIRRKFIKGRHE